jgi:hypothetical protein
LAKHVIRFEEVTVVALKSEFTVFSGVFDFVDESVLEVRFTISASEVSVSFLDFFVGIKKASEVGVTGAFSIHHWNTFAV